MSRRTDAAGVVLGGIWLGGVDARHADSPDRGEPRGTCLGAAGAAAEEAASGYLAIGDVAGKRDPVVRRPVVIWSGVGGVTPVVCCARGDGIRAIGDVAGKCDPVVRRAVVAWSGVG